MCINTIEDIVGCNNPTMIGVNTDFVVVFNTLNQIYHVFYKGKILLNKFRYADVKSYLN